MEETSDSLCPANGFLRSQLVYRMHQQTEQMFDVTKWGVKDIQRAQSRL